jgi:hypothetical protein
MPGENLGKIDFVTARIYEFPRRQPDIHGETIGSLRLPPGLWLEDGDTVVDVDAASNGHVLLTTWDTEGDCTIPTALLDMEPEQAAQVAEWLSTAVDAAKLLQEAAE